MPAQPSQPDSTPTHKPIQVRSSLAINPATCQAVRPPASQPPEAASHSARQAEPDQAGQPPSQPPKQKSQSSDVGTRGSRHRRTSTVSKYVYSEKVDCNLCSSRHRQCTVGDQGKSSADREQRGGGAFATTTTMNNIRKSADDVAGRQAPTRASENML